MASPCTNDPNEVISAVVGIQSAEEDFERELDDASSAATENADKFDAFVNGTDTQTVQLGEGSPTPTIRNTVRQMLSGAATLDSADVSGKSATANGGAEMRTLAERFEDIINAKDFGAKGDGLTDDTAAFATLETSVTGRFVNLCGGSYLVDSIPSGNYYYNGSFVVGSETKRALDCTLRVEEGTSTNSGVVGRNCVITGKIPDGYRENKHRVIAIGTDALKSLDPDKDAGNIIAIGNGVMSENHPGDMGIGIGTFALHNNSNENSDGDRNVAIGTLALFGTTTGRANVALGRDTGQCITTGSYNTCLGYAAIGGIAPVGLNGSIVTNNTLTGDENTCVGHYSGTLLSSVSKENCIIGSYAASNAPISEYNCVFGANAFRRANVGISVNGKPLIKTEFTGTYSQSGNLITITLGENDTNSAVAGCYVDIRFTSGELNSIVGGDRQYLYVSSVSSRTFTVTSPASMTASGSCTVYAFEQTGSASTSFSNNVGIGHNAGYYATSCNRSVLIGNSAAQMKGVDTNVCSRMVVIGNDTCVGATNLSDSVFIGNEAGKNLEQSSYSVVVCPAGSSSASVKNLSSCVVIGSTIATSTTDDTLSQFIGIGYRTGFANISLGNSVYIGGYAGSRPAETTYCTALGRLAMYDANNTTSLTNCTALGYNAQVTGSNQVQLGNNSTTTYAYGAVQNRSDARDKTDIRDTQLGLDFLLKLRPVDFRWDYRDAYVDVVERNVESVDDEGNAVVETVSEIVRVEKDGSRKRNRFHHGLIAQEVKAVLDEKGIDFGGYQDHSINGGKDVLTLGYEEFIAPIIKSLQEIDARLKTLEA